MSAAPDIESLRVAAATAARARGDGADLPEPPAWIADGPPPDEAPETHAERVRSTEVPEQIERAQRAPQRSPISWDSLEGRIPPGRDWIIPHWIPAGHMTLLAGRGGIGKTLIAQHIATALALGRPYLEPLEPRRVLMWAGEDDEAELWRRQTHISSWLAEPLGALTERLYLYSYAGADITLAAPVYGTLARTPMMDELSEQVRDHRAEVVILDNVARIYGGSENDRHAVTTMLAWLAGACAPAAVLLLSHPAKAEGSEYSGSTAWEGAVRARLYLSDRPPDQEAGEDAPIDDRVRYLARRKANYSALDIRRLTLTDGVLVPDAVEPAARRSQPSGEYLADIVRRGIRSLATRGLYGAESDRSSRYLPRLMRQYRLLDTATERAVGAAMRELIMAGGLEMREVGRDKYRRAQHGLVLTEEAS